MKWNEKEIKKLIELNQKGITDKEIAIELNSIFHNHRTSNSVEHKRGRNLGLQKPLNIDKDKDNSMDFIIDNQEIIIKTLKQNIFKNQTVPIFSDKTKHNEKAVLVLSDIHCGMVNRIFDRHTDEMKTTYNTKIRQEEMKYLSTSIFKIKKLLYHSFNLNHLIIFNLGDNITNDRIFGGQIFHIDKCVGLQVLEMVTDLSNFIKEMKKFFNKVTMVCMVGNHGRSLGEYKFDEPIENNYEYIMYKIIQKTFENDKTVEIIVPNTHFYIYKIYEHKYFLTHGDILRGFTRNAIERSIKDYVIAHESDFDIFVMGHYHRIDKMTLSEHSIALVNGCWISKDKFGFKIARQYSKPQQWFFGVSKKRAITWDFVIDLIET